ncbi:hypothetical protein J6590_065458 [Homalodisca vitripennis]|nr:hypothetical protein J6590_065458 [Homalodisca vitripennis]
MKEVSEETSHLSLRLSGYKYELVPFPLFVPEQKRGTTIKLRVSLDFCHSFSEEAELDDKTVRTGPTCDLGGNKALL